MEIGDAIYTASNIFSSEECQRCIERCESIGFEPASLSILGGAVRNNDRVILDDRNLAAEIWARIKPSLPSKVNDRAIGLHERFKCYRYSIGHKYSRHFDGAYRSQTGALSLLTFILYLNAGYEGGETVVSGIPIVPETGKVLMFKHQLWHESVEMRSGRKYILRSDVMFI